MRFRVFEAEEDCNLSLKCQPTLIIQACNAFLSAYEIHNKGLSESLYFAQVNIAFGEILSHCWEIECILRPKLTYVTLATLCNSSKWSHLRYDNPLRSFLVIVAISTQYSCRHKAYICFFHLAGRMKKRISDGDINEDVPLAYLLPNFRKEHSHPPKRLIVERKVDVFQVVRQRRQERALFLCEQCDTARLIKVSYYYFRHRHFKC